MSKSRAEYTQEAEASVAKVEDWRQTHWTLYRFGEILPGFLVWTVLIFMLTLAVIRPVWAAPIMIVYVLSWFFRSLRFTYFLILSYRPFIRSMATPWQKKLEADPNLMARAKEIHHIILAATYKEEYETLARTVRILAKSTFPRENVVYVLATEGRDHEHAQVIAQKLKRLYGHYFADFLITEHPADIEGEVKGKGTNISWAGRIMRDYVAEKKWDPTKVLVTSIDADHRLHPEYLSALTMEYLRDPDPEKSTYVSVALFFNNIWDVPSAVRFIHFSSTFWMMTTSVWTSRLHNVMTQTQTMSALTKTDFYSPTSIVEDGHQYWRSLFVFGDEYKVKMVLMPVFSDAVLTDTWWGTIREQYLQRRRWHYGISDFPFVLTHFVYEKKNRTARVLVDMLRHWEGHFSLATSSIMLGVVGWLPMVFTSTTASVMGVNFRFLYARVLRLAFVGILASVFLSYGLIPPKQKGKPASKLYILWDYLLLPLQIVFTIILAASVPSMDSHTRLMLGKYLGFRVTLKAVSKKTEIVDRLKIS